MQSKEFVVEKLIQKGRTMPEDILRLKEEKRLFLYGNGERAKHIKEKLINYSIHLDGILVSKEYIDNENDSDHSVIIYDDNLAELDSASIIAGFDIFMHRDLTERLINNPSIKTLYVYEGSYMMEKGQFQYYDSKIYFIDDYYETFQKRNLSYEFLLDNKEKFEQTYEWLEDDISKETMIQYLRGHIELIRFPFKKIWDLEMVENQYFSPDIISLKDNETFVDVGAYTGDTLEIFSKKVSHFNKYYALEPNEKCFEALNDVMLNCQGKGQCIHIPKGAWNECGVMELIDATGCGVVINGGESSVAVDRIDNILQDDAVSFIKMDIEGAELKALEGAENTIKRCKPVLAICVYHKREDLISIPQYIKSLSASYMFFLRPHRLYIGEVVLYAVQNEKAN